MAKTFVQDGCRLDLIAPSGGVTAGTPVLMGTIVVIPSSTVAQTLAFVGMIAGVHLVTKAASQAWTVGAKVYWDDTNKNFTTTASENTAAGIAVEAVGSGAGETTGKVLLNGLCA